MKRILLGLLLFSIITVPAAADDFVRLAGEIQVPVPDGWQLDPDAADYPFQIAHVEPLAQFLVFKSVISAQEAVRNRDDLRRSVERVVQDVILQLPESKLLTSTGYAEASQSSFTIEFTSTDTVNAVQLRHRFTGIIYRLPDGRQVLFTLWGRTAADDYPEMGGSLELIQQGFAYTGPRDAEVFAGVSYSYWYVFPLVLMLAGLLWVFRRRPRAGLAVGASRSSRYWNCPCGRANPTSRPTCRRCGRPRAGSDAARLDGS
ncbi:MAG TPA: hypothetical protein VMY05_12585 [Acidobacteriota bacterium]|nr:hypothetical protein [Acidobacteriota bacterium]